MGKTVRHLGMNYLSYTLALVLKCPDSLNLSNQCWNVLDLNCLGSKVSGSRQQKYIMYCTDIGGGPSYGHRWHVYCRENFVKYACAVFQIWEQTGKQTYKHADYNTLHLTPIREKVMSTWITHTLIPQITCILATPYFTHNTVIFVL